MAKTYGAAGRIAAAFIHSKLTPLFMLASMALGALAVVALPREEEPQIVVPMVDVFAGMPGATPADVEQRTSQSVSIAQGPKLSANGLEIALQREPQFRPESQLHCKKATPGWDYTCSYMPTPLLSATRVQFGVKVDATRWIELSRVVPAGTIIPRPQKRDRGDTRP